MFFTSNFNRHILAKKPNAKVAGKTNPKKNVKFIGSPLGNVLLMLSAMFAVSGIFQFLEWRKLSLHAQIQIRDSVDVATNDTANGRVVPSSSEIFGGEVFDTSIRLREIATFGLALCVSVLDEAGTKRIVPGSINGLLDAAVSRNLLPPGFKVANGEIRTPSSRIYVRYQVAPVRLEIISLSLDARSGPALMMRFPLESSDGKNIDYFQSNSTSNVNLPAPFVPTHTVIKSDWTLETWRGLEQNGNQNSAEMLIEEQRQFKERGTTGSTR